MKNLYALALTGALAALIAGCGSSKKSATTSGTTASAATPAAASESAQGPYGGGSKTSSGASASSGQAVTVSTKHNELGTILAAGPKQRTVYLFEADQGSSSSCTGACEKAWPPVTGASAGASGSAQQGDLGTTTRAGGAKQVTYKGHPLYYYARDEDAEDAYGQGSKEFGASWYVLNPDGAKIDSD